MGVESISSFSNSSTEIFKIFSAIWGFLGTPFNVGGIILRVDYILLVGFVGMIWKFYLNYVKSN